MSMAGQDADGAWAPPPRRTWTQAEAAAQLGISERLLRDLVRDGVIPVLRLGRRVLVRQATLERLLTEPEDTGGEAPIVQLMQARRRGGR